MELSFTQIAEATGMTGAGVKKRIKTNEEKLKNWIIYSKEGKITGLESEGLEAFRNLKRRDSAARSAADAKIRELETDLQHLKSLLDAKAETIEILKSQNEDYRARNQQLEAELQQLRGKRGLFAWLTHKN